MIPFAAFALAFAMASPTADDAIVSSIDRQQQVQPAGRRGSKASTGLAGNTFHIQWIKPSDNAKCVGILSFTDKTMNCPELGLIGVPYTKSGSGKGAASSFTVDFADAEGNTFNVSGALNGGKIKGTYTCKPKMHGAQVSFPFETIPDEKQ